MGDEGRRNAKQSCRSPLSIGRSLVPLRQHKTSHLFHWEQSLALIIKEIPTLLHSSCTFSQIIFQMQTAISLSLRISILACLLFWNAEQVHIDTSWQWAPVVKAALESLPIIHTGFHIWRSWDCLPMHKIIPVLVVNVHIWAWWLLYSVWNN